MARQVITPGSIDSDGLLFKVAQQVEGRMGEFTDINPDDDPEFSGLSFMNDGDKRTLIAVDNSLGEVSTTLTIETYGTVDGCAIADRTVVVGAGDIVLVRPGPASVYNQPDGSIYFNLTPITNVQVAVVKVAP